MSLSPTLDSPSRIRWQIPAAARLYWKCWDDQYVVYNAGSGHTHVVDALGALLIKQIAERPFSTGQIVEHVVSVLAVAPTEELQKKLQQMLEQFEKLGLIEAVSS